MNYTKKLKSMSHAFILLYLAPLPILIYPTLSLFELNLIIFL